MIRYQDENEIIMKYALIPPVDVKKIISEIGITYVERPMPKGQSGFIEYDGWTCVIAVNVDDGPQRKRFTAAHELGHFLKHRDLLKKHKHLDRLYDEYASRNPEQPLDYQHEVQANQFAASLLMPRRTIENEIAKGVTSIRELARTFDVSRMAMEYRLKALNLNDRVNDEPEPQPVFGM